jgi:cell division protein FtsL
MNEELTAEEACRNHLLTAEDFARTCNEDGSLKTQAHSTTFTVKNDKSKSITINNTALQVALVVAVLIMAVLTTLLIKHHLNKNKTKHKLS